MSADPERDEAARFPCLATAQPQAAATRAAVVEMLNVPEPSPPVPAVSTRSSRAGVTGTTCARMARAEPTSSSTVSPLARSATSSPAIWAGSASPRITSPITSSVSPALRASPGEQAVDRLRDHARAPHAQEVTRDHVARGREHRLRVELHAVQVGDVAVAQRHDLAVAVARRGDQHLRQRLDGRQRVVAARLEELGQAVQQVVGLDAVDGADLAVHQPPGALDHAAVAPRRCTGARGTRRAPAPARRSARSAPPRRPPRPAGPARARRRGASARARRPPRASRRRGGARPRRRPTRTAGARGCR